MDWIRPLYLNPDQKQYLPSRKLGNNVDKVFNPVMNIGTIPASGDSDVIINLLRHHNVHKLCIRPRDSCESQEPTAWHNMANTEPVVTNSDQETHFLEPYPRT